MTPQEIQEKLESLKGKTCEYALKPHKVLNYTISIGLGKFSIKTDRGSIQKSFESAYSFFDKYFLELTPDTVILDEEEIPTVPAEKPKNGKELAPAIVATNGLASDLISILKSNIEKVEKDPKFIPQAQTIDKQVQTILNVKKMELDYYRTMRQYPLPKEDQDAEECDATEVK